MNIKKELQKPFFWLSFKKGLEKGLKRASTNQPSKRGFKTTFFSHHSKEGFRRALTTLFLLTIQKKALNVFFCDRPSKKGF
jgi:hypothetical protein